MEKDTYGNSLLLVSTFFVLTPIALITSLYALFTFSYSQKNGIALAKEAETLASSGVLGTQIYASLPETTPLFNLESNSTDARAEIVRQYLQRYESPLSAQADIIVQMADKYDVDFRLITAIAQQESNLCKKIPEETYNCWGWGIHSKGTLGFESFEHGIEVVTRGIRKDYYDLGYVTPLEIMSKWVPHSPQGAWAQGVQAFMQEME
ncbi:hypothetical protein A2382_00135 [Candidatus Woesebacteria bacterium RIFOXYB1_FULL_38_16]|uniref:Mannosyl-glycoprotein endo-beta-N-acetylglucosamidase-like domain-containing protein n=1 Tax=Candidatus Woesebacteria bacterium RIFOXYB1_FULL_38_16 TaxID=1802538 RepID=A0A1F8CV80_9BACT|nr:MAG: hypothetical protein A2191_00805 [Candidatus Woesebacteria bacterium RIFOXYA1_FULL_38_9]OGM80182.1 MAG: hypothetical protein A2382_00135 [Candidatus Woesebacteria bacterium RIFOXYB1_FULL_38_16]